MSLQTTAATACNSQVYGLYHRQFPSGLQLTWKVSTDINEETNKVASNTNGPCSIPLPRGITLCIVLHHPLNFIIESEQKFRSIAATSVPGVFAVNVLHPAHLNCTLQQSCKQYFVCVSVPKAWIESQLSMKNLQECELQAADVFDRQLPAPPIREDRVFNDYVQPLKYEEAPQLKNQQIRNEHKYLDSTIKLFLQSHLQLIQWRANEQQKKIANEIAGAAELSTAFYSLVQNIKVLEFIEQCFTKINSDYLHPPNQKNTINSKYLLKALNIKNYIDANIVGAETPLMQIKLEWVAKATGTSVSNLQRIYKLHFGQTVVEYVRRQRLQIARDAILIQGKSIGEAAYLAGYNHPSNFSAAFKKEFGFSPGNL